MAKATAGIGGGDYPLPLPLPRQTNLVPAGEGERPLIRKCITDEVNLSVYDDSIVTKAGLTNLLKSDPAEKLIGASIRACGVPVSMQGEIVPPRQILYLLTQKNLPDQVRQNLTALLVVMSVRNPEGFGGRELGQVEALLQDANPIIRNRAAKVCYLLPSIEITEAFLPQSFGILKYLLDQEVDPEQARQLSLAPQHERNEYHGYRRKLISEITNSFCKFDSWKLRLDEVIGDLKSFSKFPMLKSAAFDCYTRLTLNQEINSSAREDLFVKHFEATYLDQNLSRPGVLTPEILQRIVDRLPLGDEQKDRVILAILSAGLSNKAIRTIAPAPIQKIYQISGDESGPEKVRITAGKLLENIKAVFPAVAREALKEVKLPTPVPTESAAGPEQQLPMEPSVRTMVDPAVRSLGVLPAESAAGPEQLPMEPTVRNLRQLINELLSLNEGNEIARGLAALGQGDILQSKALGEVIPESFPAAIKELGSKILAINKALDSDCFFCPQQAKIAEFTSEQLLTTSKAAFEKNLSISDPQDYGTAMALIARATKLDRGYYPRLPQVICASLLLDKQEHKGRLLQVKTGEGKTLINAMTAAGRALFEKKKPNIITSSSVLAIRDSEENAGFFSLLGITSSHNCFRQNTSGSKPCYDSQVVYGDLLNFQADWLRTIFKGEGIMGNRKFDAVLVDEVDSMMIDESARIAKIATPICGMEHLEAMFIFIYRQLEFLSSAESVAPLTVERLEDEEYRSNLIENIAGTINSLLAPATTSVSDVGFKLAIPKFLYEFVSMQNKFWAESAIQAFKMKENVDYVISRNDKGDEVIAPVDFNSTGVVQTNTSWGFGLHPFLQAKHRLRMTPESLTTSFISNMGYFKLYGSNISGMSGTLGSREGRSLLEEVYDLDTIVVPTFKPRRYEQRADLITGSNEEHLDKVASTAIREGSAGRAVLIISETIARAREFIAALKEKGYTGNLREYTRSDYGFADSSESELKAGRGDIIVATNLAGRGTDIKTDEVVEAAGGLHVIVSFLPGNLRVEEQAFGRTSRQGNKGSGQMIIYGPETRKKFGAYGADLEVDYRQIVAEDEKQAASPDSYTALCMSKFKSVRDQLEQTRLDIDKKFRVKSLEFADNLFTRFNNEVYQPLKKLDPNSRQKLMQLEDLWGFFLSRQGIDERNSANLTLQEVNAKQAEILKHFEEFKRDCSQQYRPFGPGIIINPAYMSNYVLNRLGEDLKYHEPCDLLKDPNEFDPIYSYQLHNLRAYAHLRYNSGVKEIGKGTEWKQQSTMEAMLSLNTALNQIESVILPQLQASLLFIGPEHNNSPLYKQFDNKIRLLETAAGSIRENLKFIQNNNHAGENTMVVANDSLQGYMELFGDQIDPRDIQEFGNFGMSFLYRADAQKYKKDYLSGTVVAIAGIAQVVVGAVMAIGTVGFAAEFGIGLAAGGISDIIAGVQSGLKGKGIDLGAWAQGKGIELAINFAIAGISSKINAASNAAKAAEMAEAAEAAKVAGTLAERARTIELCTAFGIAVGRRIATSYIAEFAGRQLERAAAKPIKAEIKHLEAAIRNSLKEQEINRKMQDVCRIDRLGRPGRHGRQFQTEVLSVINQKSSQFADIAQTLISSSVSSAVAARGGGFYGAVAVTAAGTAVNVARGVGNIDELKDYLLSGIGSSATKVHTNLPTFEQLLSYSCRGMKAEEAAEIASSLRSSTILTGQYQVNVAKIGFMPGMENSLPLLSHNIEAAALSASARSAPQVYDYPDLNARSSQNIPQIPQIPQFVVSAPVNSGSRQQEIDLPGGNKWRMQTVELLHDLDKASAQNYDAEIDQIASNISGVVSDRMRGLIRSGIINPISGAVVSTSISYVMDEMGLQKTLEEVLVGKSADFNIRSIQQEKRGQKALAELEKMSLALENELSEITGVSAGGNDDTLVSISEKSFMADKADKLIKLAEKYEKFAQKYPWLAENGLKVVSITLKAGFVVATGGTGLLICQQ
jgi:hypothetical protein